jgi:transposase
MNELHLHYRLLLGLDASWVVSNVELSLPDKRVEIQLDFIGSDVTCPECGCACKRHDMAPERTWRHLDTMQFETLLRARVPRSDCSRCGVKTVNVPWADKHSRFTLLFEAFAIEVLRAASNVRRAAAFLELDWDTVHSIMERGVERGLAKRSVEKVQHVGLDEKSFRQGQSYVSLMVDLDESRVLEVVPDRTTESAKNLWESLPETQRSQVTVAVMDMSGPYEEATVQCAPQAVIVHDKFHISKHLNEAVDQVRRTENKALQQEGDDRLKRTRQLWLFRQHNLSEEQITRFGTLRESDLKTARAWAIKENFNWFWTYQYPATARKYFQEWYGWASRSRLTPIIRVAKMLKRRFENIITHIKYRFTNAAAEGFNSKIQSLKSNARGFRSFQNYRTRILFYCGKLDVMPPTSSH